MSIYQAKVSVYLRPSVLDPAGEASKAAAIRLGIKGISKIRIGKSIIVEIEADCADHAKQSIELLSDRLLSNPVIENWSFEVEELNETAAS